MDENEFDFENRIMSSSYDPQENENENTLRPQTLDEYIGQEKAKANLKIIMEAAKLRGEQIDHVLLYGPPGLGKTTLSAIIASEMGVNLRITSGSCHREKGRPCRSACGTSGGGRAVHRRDTPPAEDYGGNTLPRDGGLRY